jgi:hypothetical protein
MPQGRRHFPKRNSIGPQEKRVLRYIVKWGAIPEKVYESGICEELDLEPGYVSIVLKNFLEEDLIWTYSGIKVPKGRGHKRFYYPSHLALVKAVAEIRDTNAQELERWLAAFGFYPTNLPLFYSFLPDDLRHLREVCLEAIDLLKHIRTVTTYPGYSRSYLGAVYASTLIYLLRHPELKPLKKTIADRVSDLFGRLLANNELRQLFLMDIPELVADEQRWKALQEAKLESGKEIAPTPAA